MEFGLGLMNYHGCWDDAAFAEAHGFTNVGFVDSPLLAGDAFVCMGLAAQATSTIRLGTFLAIPGLRGAATTASAIATVNRLAPGRTFLGIGTGYTARDTFGVGPVPTKQLGRYAADVRALLDGEEIEYVLGDRRRPVRFRHGVTDGTDLDAHIPIYVGADGPRALKVAGEHGEGLIVTLKNAGVGYNAPEVFGAALARVKETAADAGRGAIRPYTIWSTAICVLEEGESATSPRALDRIGAAAMMAFHTYACHPEIAEHLPPFFTERIEIYKEKVLSHFPADRVYQDAHKGHLAALIEGEDAVLTDQIVRLTTLTGTAKEIVAELGALQEAGLDNLSVWAPPQVTRETILSIERDLMPHLPGRAA